jgi:hypothetical protein
MKYQYKGRRYNFYKPLAVREEHPVQAALAALGLVIFLGSLILIVGLALSVGPQG